jgi:hypothetical protein
MYGPEPEVETSWTAIAALIIAIVAIILIVVVIWLTSSGSASIVDRFNEWVVIEGSTTPGSFDGAPNNIFQVPATTAAYSLAITPYSTIGSFVTTGNPRKTTLFRIDNSLNTATAAVVNITGNTPSAGGPTPGAVPAGAVYEYEWTSLTTYKLIGWSKNP